MDSHHCFFFFLSHVYSSDVFWGGYLRAVYSHYVHDFHKLEISHYEINVLLQKKNKTKKTLAPLEFFTCQISLV